MRPPEPEFVTAWRNQPPAPKCCHTCEHYQVNGQCDKHETEPPSEFTIMLNACPDWMQECPF